VNAEHLLAHVLGMRNRINLYLEFERPLGEAERLPLRELVRKRGEGVPLQHLLGPVEFCGRVFGIDGRALIPRPETEQLVEHVLAELQGSAGRVLDVGTGSGVIALTVAIERPGMDVTGVDVSDDALSLAAENAGRHGLGGRVAWVRSDLTGGVTGVFDAAVANLPYIPRCELEGLAREVQHDPTQALDGGVDGLDLIRRFCDGVRAVLACGGLVALEVGHDQAGRVAAILGGNNFRDIKRIRDYQGFERFLIARHG
jgi:release factor glutamine methyltransferase